MLQISCLAPNTFLIIGIRNEYIISKRYSGTYAVIPVKNNPNADPLIMCKSLDDCIKFIGTADNAEPID